MTSQPPRRSAYSMGSLPNMLRSLLVIALFVVALVALVPRMSSVDRPGIGATEKAGQVAAETGWPVELPVGLGEGWVPTVATLAAGSGQVRTFTTVWKAPDGDVSLKQAVAVSGEWVARTLGDGAATGTTTIGSRTWERYVTPAASQVTYLLRGAGKGGLTIAVTGDTPDAELRTFVSALKVVPPTS